METCHPYKPGTIKFIKVVNFMCHDAFEINLGPRVNFVIGPNGSGKSALLTAIVVALGGRATLTQRAKKISDFIKNGKKHAEITIVIHNYDKIMEMDRAYKPDDYGKEITVHKTIYKEETSRLVLKSDKNKKISERKAELDEMIDHFNILINNPICILNQEVSKTFLHSKKPEDKFDLFMKATNLEQIEQDYLEARQSHKDWEENNKSKTVAFKLLDSEYMSCREKTSFLQNRAKLNDSRQALNIELIWALNRDNEVAAERLGEKIEDIEKKISELQRNIRDKENKIKVHMEDIQIAQTKTDDMQKDHENATKEVEETRAKETAEKEKRVAINSRINSLKRSIERHLDDKNSLEKAIAELKQQLEEQNNLDHNTERRKIDIERLEKAIPADKAKEKSIRLHSDQLERSLRAIREEVHAANNKLNALKGKHSASISRLKRLKGGQENSLRKYGDQMIRIRQEVEDAFQAGKFIHKPLGPLGYFLKLQNPDMAYALETHLGKTAHAFVCDNSQDMRALQALFKNMSASMREFRQPLVIARKFGRRLDTSRFRAAHPQHKTFLDCIEIENDCVHNTVVDRNFLESVLFIPDFYEAENLLINQSTVPTNTRMAYTKDCYCIHPNINDSNYKCFSNDPKNLNYLFADNNAAQIKEIEKEIDQCNYEIRDAEKAFNDINVSMNNQKKELDNNTAEVRRVLEVIRANEIQLLELKTTISKEPQELSALEGELESHIAEIAKAKLNLERENDELKHVAENIENIISKKEIRQKKLKRMEEERQQIFKIIASHKKAMSDNQKVIKETATRIENITKDKEEALKALEESLEKVARSKIGIPQDLVKPRCIRPTEAIKEDLRKVEAQLRVVIEEHQDPDVMMESLKKRMKEIESLSELKETNLQNFASMGKLLDERKEGYANLRQSTVSSVSTTFATVMRTMKMNGELQIHIDDVIDNGHVVKKAKTLEIRVDTNYISSQRPTSGVMSDETNSRRGCRSQPPTKRPCREQNHGKENDLRMTDTRSLSGGERSFSTVAFVLALWHHCASPFKLMDEIDVFMDMVTRRVSYGALIRYAQLAKDPGQFIFFSPLELPKIDDASSFVRVFEMPSIVRKGNAATQEA